MLRKWIVLGVFLQIGCLHLQPADPVQPTVWILGYDTTASVPLDQFKQYPDVIRSTLLTSLRPKDTVIVISLDGRAPETFVMDGRLSELKRQADLVYERLSGFKQSPGPHGTNLGLILKHARRRIELDQSWTTARGELPSYVLVILTDGVPDGRQSNVGFTRSIPEDSNWRILFLGTRAGTEETLHKLCEDSGFRRRERILVVPFNHVRGFLPSIQKFIAGKTDVENTVSLTSHNAGGSQ